MSKHIQLYHPKDYFCGPYGCSICNLYVCAVCGGFEGSLTNTDCPGRPITEQEADDIYKNGLDFVNGEWVRTQ